MLSQIGCITMEPGALDRVYTGEELTDEEKKTFAAHPAAGGELLSRIPRLEAVAQMIAGQNLAYGEQPPAPGRQPHQVVAAGAGRVRAAPDYAPGSSGRHSAQEAADHLRRKGGH